MLLEVCLVLAALLVLLVLRDRKPSSLPPGPWEFPFLGRFPSLAPVYLLELKKKFGDVVATRTGSMRTVFLFDYKTAKDVLSRSAFAGRPTYFKDFMVDDQMTGGVAMSNGAQWLHDRRFMIRNLRNFGMGKTYLEDAMNIEAQALVDDLKKYNGEPINYPSSFRTAPLNVIWQMMAGCRYDLRSVEVAAIFQASKDFFESSGAVTWLPSCFPILKSLPLPSYIEKKLFLTDVKTNFKECIGGIVGKAIAEHEANFDPNNLRDLIDEYLLDMKAAEEKGEPHYFRKGALCQIVGDGFDAGSDTVNYSLRWVVYLLARHPALARQLQQQVDDVLPRDQLVSTADKPNLPLVESFVNEMFRFACIFTTIFEREAMEDTTINGYFVQKGTVIRPVILTMHFDENIFDKPFKFRADRFLDQAGQFQAPKEGIFLFGAGRRACPGEQLARAEVFLFSVALLQNFVILPAEGVTLLKEPNDMEFGLRIPHDQKLVYRARA